MKWNEEQIRNGLAERSDWKREDGKWIVRKYRFPSFREAMGFVNAVADIAERMKHHPFITIEYKVVTLRLTSWNAGGLTGLDFAAADEYDRTFAQMCRK